jgi:O-antigen ligase
MLEEIKNRNQLYRLFAVVVVAAVLGLLRGLYYFIVINPPIDISIEIIYMGLSRLRNSAVFALIMFIFSVAMVTILPRGRRRSIFVVLTLFFMAMVMLAFARSLWLAAIFGLAFLFLVSWTKQKANFMKLILIGIVALSLYIAIAMSVPTDNPLYKSVYAIEKRYQSVFTAREEPSIMTRGSEWDAAKRKALGHPVLGNGLGTEITYFRYDTWLGTQTWNTTRYIHNAYLLIFLNMGLAGLLSFLWLTLALMRYGLKVYWSLEQGEDKAVALGVASGFATLMVASLAGPFLVSPVVTMWLGFFAGALIIIDRERRLPAIGHRP